MSSWLEWAFALWLFTLAWLFFETWIAPLKDDDYDHHD